MAEPREHPDALRLLVVFLRFHGRMSQAGLARATRLAQSRISMLENGEALPAEDVLRRIASAAGVRWELVTHLRRYVNDFLYAAEQGGAVPPNRAADPVPLAISAYLLEDMAAAQAEPPVEARETAERFWKGVAGLPPPRRRRVIELSPRASTSWALAELLCHESERAAAEGSQEALELAELALSVAGRVEGNEEWKRRIQGYAWAYVGNARRDAEDPSGAHAAFAKARELWGSGASPETGPLQEWRLLSLEAPR